MPIAWVDVPDPHNPPAGAPKLSAANLARLALVEDIGVAGTPAGDAGRAAYGVPAEVAGKRAPGWWDTVTALTPSQDQPTISLATTSAVSGTNTIAPSTDLLYDAHFRYDGCLAVNSPSAGFINSTTTPGLILPEFVTDDANTEFEMPVRASDVTYTIRVEVDGHPHSLRAQSFVVTSNTTYYVRVTFPTARSRRIKVWHTGSDWFGGVKVAPGQTVTRPAQEVKRRLVVLADSYGAGGPTYPSNGNRIETFPYWLGKLLEADSVINLSEGGTGWVNDNGAGRTYGVRIPDVLAAKPHMVFVVGSRNDITAGFDQSLVYPNALAGLTQLSSVPVVYVGSSETASSTLDVITAGLKAAAQRAGRKFLDLRGTETDTVSNHPTFANQLTIAQAIYAGVDRSHLDATVAAAVWGRTGVTLTLAASPSSAATSGATVTLTATLSAAQPGTVAFLSDGVQIGSSAVSGTTASMTTTTLPTGSHNLSARFQPTDPSTVKPASSNLVAYTISSNLGFTDNFNRADGALGSTGNGKTWVTTGSGAFAIVSNKAANSTASANGYAVVDAQTPSGTLTVTLGGTVAAGAGILAARYQDSSNHLFVAASGTGGRLKLWKRVAGASTAITTGANGNVPVAGDVVALVFAGDTITVKQNGTTIDTVTDATFNTATLFGLYAAAAGTAITWDDISFA